MSQKTKKELAEQAVQVICKSTMVNILVIGEVEEGLTPNLKEMAEAVTKHLELDEAVMENYDKEIENITDETKVQPITNEEAEETREIVYEMCDALKSVKQTMKYVRTVAEMMFLWQPYILSEK